LAVTCSLYAGYSIVALPF